MKPDAREITRIRELMFGRNQHRLIEHCGTFFPWWLDEELHTPPPDLNGNKLRKWYDRRAKYRYSIDEILADGSIRLLCPQCAGRIKSNLKTRNPKAKPNKKARLIVRTDPAQYCCPGRVTVPVEHLDRYQAIPYGTTAWKLSYNRRNQIENLNGILRDKGGLEDKWCRALGTGARFVGSVMMGVAYLLRETKQDWLDSNGDPHEGDTEPDASQASTDDTTHNETDTGPGTDHSRDGPP